MAERVRFAPSPTGFLHIGGARTALYNWLWARHTGGAFILRIEDTDRERSTVESVQVILDSMRWLGLDWDEGPRTGDDREGGPHAPYFQTARVARYRAAADDLVSRGRAYRCFCTREELDAQRQQAEKAGRKFVYPKTCRARTDAPDRPHVIRLAAPSEGSTAWTDLVKGHIEVPNDAQQDVVLLRSDGMPLYNFGAVVDDIEMGVTLVARGDDHVVNTPAQIMLFAALDAAMPRFAHLPMILGQDGKKLSKRHAAVSVLDYRDAGYLPIGLANYLVRLGWSHGDEEIFTLEEMVAKFDWAHVGAKDARFDEKKLVWVNHTHQRKLEPDVLGWAADPFIRRRGIEPIASRLNGAIATVRERATTLVQVAEMTDYYFREPPVMDDAARKKQLTPASAPHLRALAELFAATDPFDAPTLEARLSAWLAERALSMKDVAQPARVALTGRTASPGLYEVMVVLGRDTVVARLERAAEIAEQATGATPGSGEPGGAVAP